MAGLSGFLVALQFLTRIPSPLRRPILEAEMGPSMRWFPLVGALIGGLLGLVDLALTPLVAVEIRAMALVAGLALLTGALHLDGLMDTCDGLMAFTTPERRLEIMRDSHVGSFAVVGAAILVLAKYAAFVSLPAAASGGRLAALVAIGALSRWAMVYAAQRYPLARKEGLAHAYREGLRLRDLLWATLMVALLLVALGLVGMGRGAAVLFLVAWGLTAAGARYTLGKIPGLTGDIYGAICEVVEVGVAMAMWPVSQGLWGVVS